MSEMQERLGPPDGLVPRIAASDADIAACYPVMRELRPHLVEGEFVARIRSLQERGYELAYIEVGGRPVSVAGFRIGDSLAWGRHIYVDDLVTASEHRSRGYGAILLAWLRRLAAERGCRELHLDSRLHRTDAHRFYRREGMTITSYHFKVEIE